MSNVKLRVHNISKSFPGVQALNKVTFEVRLFVNSWGGIFLNPAPLLFLALILQIVEIDKAIHVIGCT